MTYNDKASYDSTPPCTQHTLIAHLFDIEYFHRSAGESETVEIELQIFCIEYER